MILYNMRERGPYEYDKFVLNILQLYNAINLAEINELSQTNAGINSLNSMSTTVNSLYNKIIGTESEKGVTEQIFTKFHEYKEEF